MFRIGEKVVFKPIKDDGYLEWVSVNPIPEGEIVTVDSFCNIYSNSVNIKEYPVLKDGHLFSVNVRHFRKLDNSQTSEILEMINEFGKQHERVKQLVHDEVFQRPLEKWQQ